MVQFFVFALTAFMGYTLGPVFKNYLSLANGNQIVMNTSLVTGVMFLSLSGYALTSKKYFSFMGAFLMVGIIVGFLAGLVIFLMPSTRWSYPQNLKH